MQKHPDDDAICLFALSSLKKIGQQKLRHLLEQFPSVQALTRASLEQLIPHLQRPLALAFYEQLHAPGHWQHLCQQAEEQLLRHLQLGIVPLALTSSSYPLLLKRVPDPPLILYVKGNIEVLRKTETIAIVGTRHPTDVGKRVAFHLASYLATQRYCVVSGLAKGIDTAAHEGALAACGQTIAVLGTPLDTVYPAENRDLAERILAASGVLMSELPLGQPSFRQAFVLRDRIQSGLALAVIPVQTTLDGGTMHTINFAKVQQRLIACPLPLRREVQAEQYAGIRQLLQEGAPDFYAFKAGQVAQSALLDRLQETKNRLIPRTQAERKEHSSLSEDQPAASQQTLLAIEPVDVPAKKRSSGGQVQLRRRAALAPPPQPLIRAALPVSDWGPPPQPSAPTTEPLHADAVPLWEGDAVLPRSSQEGH